MTDVTCENDLWSNFNSEWLSEQTDITPLLTWLLMHADSHIQRHEQLILHHTAQAQHWHKLKRASQRHIAQHAAAASTASGNITHSAASPLKPLSLNLALSPLSSPTSPKRVKAPTDSQLRHRFTAVLSAHKTQEAGGRGKENEQARPEVEAALRRVKAAAGGGSGVKADGGSASKGVKFAEQATVIGQGDVPVKDKATKKQLLKEKDRQQPATDQASESTGAAIAVLPTPNLSEEPAVDPGEKEQDKAEEEDKQQPSEEDAVEQLAIFTPTRKQSNTTETLSPELVLPSLSTLLQSVCEDEDSSTVSLHITASPVAVLSPSSSPVAPPPPPPSPAVAESPPPSRLSPFLQFHPSLSDHPYHQALTAHQAIQPAATPLSPSVPPFAPSLPPRKKGNAPPALTGGVVRFRVDSEAESSSASIPTASTAAGSGSSVPLSPAPTTPHSASLLSPPPLPPRRPALPTSTPLSAPRTTSAASSSSSAVGMSSGAFRYVVPGQLPSQAAAPPKHRRQRSKSVDWSNNRKS